MVPGLPPTALLLPVSVVAPWQRAELSVQQLRAAGRTSHAERATSAPLARRYDRPER
jgi:hypothetical protein